MALKPRKFMISVKQPLTGEDYFVVYDDDHFIATFYLLKEAGSTQTWAVTGTVKPFSANCDDFASFDDALHFIIEHRTRN